MVTMVWAMAGDTPVTMTVAEQPRGVNRLN